MSWLVYSMTVNDQLEDLPVEGLLKEIVAMRIIRCYEPVGTYEVYTAAQTEALLSRNSVIQGVFGKRGPCACTMAPGSAPDYVWSTLKY